MRDHSSPHRSSAPSAMPALILLCALPYLAPSVADAQDKAGIRQAFTKQAEAIREEMHQLDLAWYRFLSRKDSATGGGEAKVFRLKLANAVYGKDLFIEGYRIGGDWVRAFAWSPAWNTAVHRADCSGLAITNASGRIDGTLSVVLGYDGVLPMEGAPLTCLFAVNMTLSGAGGNGTFESRPLPSPPSRDQNKAPQPPPPTIPLSKGTLTATVTDWTSQTGPPAELPVMKLGLLDLYTVYGVTLGWEADAVRFYQMIRAAEVARLCRVTYNEALRNALIYPPWRPAFDSPAVAREKKQSKTISIDDLDAGTSADGGAPAPAARPAGETDPKVKDAMETLSRILVSLQTMRRFVENAERVTGDPMTSVMRGSLKTDDPDFGPWYGMESLNFDETKRHHVVPPDAGGEGLQQWPCVPVWKSLGPFALTRWDLNTPMLPEWIVDVSASYRVDEERLKVGRSYSGDDLASWITLRPERPFGYILPPNCSSANRVSKGCSRAVTDRYSGIEYSTAYATADIFSEKDVELWTALGITQQGKLWLDDRLYWVGPERIDETASQSVNLLKLRLHQGVNRLTLRYDVGYASPSFWMRVCTRGRPRDAAAVKAHQESVAKAKETMARPAFNGWRGNGTGYFPDTDVPGAWHYKKKINVLWQTKLPYWSNASPALADDRLFVAVEPHTLLCLSKADGRVLWERPVTVMDLIENKDERAKAWKLYEDWWQARQERDAIPAADLRMDKWMEKEWYWFDGKGLFAAKQTQDTKAVSPQMTALLKKKDELESAPDPTAVQEELNKVLGQIDALKMKESEDDPNSPMKKVKRMDSAWDAWIHFLGKHSFVHGMSGYWQDYDNFCFATPVTDGKHVWWKNGMEAVACFDMDGNRKWMVRTHGGASQSAASPSPLLVDGKIVVKTPYYVTGEGNRWESSWRPGSRGIRYVAYDAATGETRWETKALPSFGWNWNANTPAVVSLTNGREAMEVLVTAGGSIVRADDGKVLVWNLGADTTDASVMPADDVVIFQRPHLVAFRLIMVDRDNVGFHRLWSHQLGSHGIGYNGSIVDPINQLLYHETGFGHYYYHWPCQYGSGPHEDPCWAIIKDLQTGEVVATPRILRNSGHMGWSLSSVTRDYVFMVGGDHIFRGGWIPPNWAVTISRGREPVVLARNVVDRTYGGAAHEKGRTYFRGYLGVTCIGYTGDEGRRYEARVFAENVLDEIHATPPKRVADPLTPAPIPQSLPEKTPTTVVIPKLEPHTWFYAGPFPPDAADAALKSLDGGKAVVKPGDKVAGGATTREFVSMDTATLKSPDTPGWEYYPNFTMVEKQRRWVDYAKVLRGQAPSVSYIFAYLSNEKACTMRFEQTTPGVRAWLGGTEVRDGDRIRLAKGAYGLLMEVKVDKIPDEGLFIGPRFFDSDDPAAEWAAWQNFAKSNRKYFDNVVKLAPDTPEGKRAKVVIDAL